MSREGKCKLVTDFLQSFVNEVKYRGRPAADGSFAVTIHGKEYHVTIPNSYEFNVQKVGDEETLVVPNTATSGLEESGYGTASFVEYVIEFFGIRENVDYAPRFNDLSYWRIYKYALAAPSDLDERFTQTNEGYGTDLHVTPSGRVKSKFRYIVYKLGENQYGVRMLGDFSVAPLNLVLCPTMPSLRREPRVTCGYIEAVYHSVEIWDSPFKA